MNDIKVMNKGADNIRMLWLLRWWEKANSGHPGGAMGGADFINVLFSRFLILWSENPAWESRDRFFPWSGPHVFHALFGALSGRFTLDELQLVPSVGNVTPAIPERNVDTWHWKYQRSVGTRSYVCSRCRYRWEVPEGRLGDIARPDHLYLYLRWWYSGGDRSRTYSGNTCPELDNLIMFYDSNNVQLSTTVEEVTIENVAQKYMKLGDGR